MELFGTDGIRGEVGKYPLTREAIFVLGEALGLWLKERYPESVEPLKIVVGKDTRDSGNELELALLNGAGREDIEAIRVGICPTPCVAYLTMALQAQLGIAISASHNPGSDNGIKFFNADGYKLFPFAEKQIEEIFNRIRLSERMYDFDINNLGEERTKLISLYSDFAKNSLEGERLTGLKIVLDCAFGSFSRIVPRIFQDLGAEVYVLNNEPDGKNINVDCGTLFPQTVAKAVLRYNADIGIAFDGDGDRVILADEKGDILDGDQILAVLVRYYLEQKKLSRNVVVCTQMSNLGLELWLNQLGIQMVRADVGDKYVLQQMLENRANLGGEQSGHIILLGQTTTGDGLIAALELIKVMRKRQKKLSQLKENLQKFPQLLVNVKVIEKKPLEHIPKLSQAIEQAREKLGPSNRIFIRYSGTENLARVMVEGMEQDSVYHTAHSLAQVIGEAVGVK
ncbi:MAG: phosphoglucosamine mutase [Candidatus Omnitrophota bacterium]